MGIDSVIERMNKKFDAEVITKASKLPPVQRVPTQLTSLDLFSGGGLPMGVPILLAGQKSSGKSAFCYHVAGQAIKKYGGFIEIVQTEAGFDKQWAKSCGLPIKNTGISDKAESLDVGLDMCLYMMKTDKPRCIIFDSLSALPADGAASVSESKSHGGRAKPMNDFFRRINGAVDKQEPPLIIFIEHLHPNITGHGYITGGGETKGYMSVLEMRFRRTGSLLQVMETDVGEVELPIEITVGWEIRKSKVSPDGGRGEFNLGLRTMDGIVAGDINDFSETLALGVHMGVVKKKGAWFQIGEEKYHGMQGLRRGLTTKTLKQALQQTGEAGGQEDSQADEGESDPE